jgi:hypothetical protein
LCESLATVVVLIVALALVAVFGHGLWLLFARMFGNSIESGTLPFWPERKMCPRCQSALRDPNACAVCNWPAMLPPKGGLAKALLQLRRQAMVFARIGLISEVQRQELMVSLGAGSPLVNEQPASATEPVADESISEVTWLDEDDLVPQAPAAITSAVVEPVPLQATSAPPDEAAVSFQPEERVRRYAASRQAAGVAMSEAPTIEPPPARRERLAVLLSAFLEERNVRWGELVGGLLIVCCSIALVISFWSEIAARPLMKFCLFNSVSAALFGAGFYTERHWKIYTTSRGILIIAILLVPLNFLAIAAFTDKSPPTDLLSLSGEATSLALFTALTYFAARVVTPDAAGLATVGVMLPSLLQLLTRRFVGPDAPPAVFYGLAAAPIAAYVGAAGLEVRRLARRPELQEVDANRLFMFLGVVTFAALLPLALLLHKMVDVSDTVHRLSPLAVLLGMPALATGVLFWKRRDEPTIATATTAGIAVGVFGALVMIAGLALAFPEPMRLVPTAVVNAAVFAFIAWWLAIPEAQLAAAVCLAIGWLIAHQALRGAVEWRQTDQSSLVHAALSASSGKALLPLSALFFAIAVAWRRAKRHADAFWWAVSAGAAAAGSLALTFGFGFGRAGDPYRVTSFFALYALVVLAAAIKTDRLVAAWAGAILVLAAFLQAITFDGVPHPALAEPWTFTLLACATTALVGRVAISRSTCHRNLAQVLWEAALVASFAAVLTAAWHARQMPWDSLARYSAWLAFIWFALSLAGELRVLWPASQIALAVAVF